LVQKIEQGQEYLTWVNTLDSQRVVSKGIRYRMSKALQGLKLGISSSTALMMCGVSNSEFVKWIQDQDNASKWVRSLASADSMLEHVVFSAALKDPKLAISLLKLKNAKRWLDKEVDIPKNDQEVKKKMSSVLKRKSKDKLEFDVDV